MDQVFKKYFNRVGFQPTDLAPLGAFDPGAFSHMYSLCGNSHAFGALLIVECGGIMYIVHYLNEKFAVLYKKKQRSGFEVELFKGSLYQCTGVRSLTLHDVFSYNGNTVSAQTSMDTRINFLLKTSEYLNHIGVKTFVIRPFKVTSWKTKELPGHQKHRADVVLVPRDSPVLKHRMIVRDRLVIPVQYRVYNARDKPASNFYLTGHRLYSLKFNINVPKEAHSKLRDQQWYRARLAQEKEDTKIQQPPSYGRQARFRTLMLQSPWKGVQLDMTLYMEQLRARIDDHAGLRVSLQPD